MASKGSIAKQNIQAKLKEVFGEDFIGEIDKKVYLWADDGGQKVQIALAMTCPKNPVGPVSADMANATDGTIFSNSTGDPKEVTEEEKQNLRDLMARLNI